ncbi:MAG: M20 metallopeptidase family protein [Bacteroidota bacterium]
MKDLKQEINNLAKEYFEEIVAIRRHLHKHPELSFREFETSGFICSRLDEWGVKYRKDIVKTGIVAEIEGEMPGKIIGFRADIDALPIREENDFDFKSINEGIMHACGHDVHTSCLLGSIRILLNFKDKLKGKIKFVFQPGEERIPGGAKLMIEEDLFDGEEPEIMIAQHVYPELESGKTGFRPGMYMASSDEIYIRVKGKGGHAALPDRLTDPVLIASHLVIALQQVVSRNNKPGVPSVLSIGKISAEGAVNVIPETVSLEGTFRTMDEEWRRKAHEKIEIITRNLCSSMGGKAEIEIRKGYPVLTNDHQLTARLKDLAIEFTGKENVEDLDIRMTAEDFAYFSQKYPSVLFRLGTAKAGEEAAALHSSRLNIDEKAIQLSMGLFSWMALNLMK